MAVPISRGWLDGCISAIIGCVDIKWGQDTAAPGCAASAVPTHGNFAPRGVARSVVGLSGLRTKGSGVEG
jgi:hypothetical protein